MGRCKYPYNTLDKNADVNAQGGGYYGRGETPLPKNKIFDSTTYAWAYISHIGMYFTYRRVSYS